MSDIPPIKGTASRPAVTPQRKADGESKAGGEPARVAATVDRVEISEMGQLLSTLEREDDIRVDKVMEIREAIANGTYETEAKLEYTISRLREILRPRE